MKTGDLQVYLAVFENPFLNTNFEIAKKKQAISRILFYPLRGIPYHLSWLPVTRQL